MYADETFLVCRWTPPNPCSRPPFCRQRILLGRIHSKCPHFSPCLCWSSSWAESEDRTWFGPSLIHFEKNHVCVAWKNSLASVKCLVLSKFGTRKYIDLVVWQKPTLSDWPVLGLPLRHCSCSCWCRSLDKTCRTNIRMNQRAESETEQACHFFVQTDLLVILGAQYRRLVNLRWKNGGGDGFCSRIHELPNGRFSYNWNLRIDSQIHELPKGRFSPQSVGRAGQTQSKSCES